MIREIAIGAGGAITAALVLGGLAKFTDWVDDLFVPAVPVGSVLAFDLESGCPRGWSEFEDARGRMILGANLNGTHHLTKRPFRDAGGDEAITLTIAEMPEHHHELNDKPASGKPGSRWVLMNNTPFEGPAVAVIGAVPSATEGATHYGGVTASNGSSKSRDNMQPYIALYFCKKNG